MIIRSPNEQLPPSLMRFALWLLSCVFGMLGLALLGVGVWAASAQDGSAKGLMLTGAGFFMVRGRRCLTSVGSKWQSTMICWRWES